MGRALHNQTTPTHLGCSPFLVIVTVIQSNHRQHPLFAQVHKNSHFPPFSSLLFLCSFHTVLQSGRHSTCGLAFLRFTHHTSPKSSKLFLWLFPYFRKLTVELVALQAQPGLLHLQSYSQPGKVIQSCYNLQQQQN